MKSKTWLILLAFMMVILLGYSGKVTNSSFNAAVSSTDNVLRVKDAPLFGKADDFAVLAGSGITNTGSTTITGDIGSFPTYVTPGGSITLFGTNHMDNTVTQIAKTDLTTAFEDAAARTPYITETTLGGLNLPPGVYHSDGALSITGILTLTGDANAVWVFQAGSTLDTAAGSRIVLSGGAKTDNVYWAVGSSATLGADSVFEGNIMAYAYVTLYSGAQVEGRVFAQTAAVTLNTNTITKPPP